jgi:hypothetical protein
MPSPFGREIDPRWLVGLYACRRGLLSEEKTSAATIIDANLINTLDVADP